MLPGASAPEATPLEAGLYCKLACLNAYVYQDKGQRPLFSMMVLAAGVTKGITRGCRWYTATVQMRRRWGDYRAA